MHIVFSHRRSSGSNVSRRHGHETGITSRRVRREMHDRRRAAYTVQWQHTRDLQARHVISACHSDRQRDPACPSRWHALRFHRDGAALPSISAQLPRLPANTCKSNCALSPGEHLGHRHDGATLLLKRQPRHAPLDRRDWEQGRVRHSRVSSHVGRTAASVECARASSPTSDRVARGVLPITPN